MTNTPGSKIRCGSQTGSGSAVIHGARIDLVDRAVDYVTTHLTMTVSSIVPGYGAETLSASVMMPISQRVPVIALETPSTVAAFVVEMPTLMTVGLAITT